MYALRVAGDEGWLWRSDDGGVTWRETGGEVHPHSFLLVSPASADSLFAYGARIEGDGGALVLLPARVSRDGGKSFVTVENPPGELRAATFDPGDDALYGFAAESVPDMTLPITTRYVLEGSVWRSVDSPNLDFIFTRVVIDGNGSWLALPTQSGFPRLIYGSADRGRTWRSIGSSPDDDPFAAALELATGKELLVVRREPAEGSLPNRFVVVAADAGLRWRELGWRPMDSLATRVAPLTVSGANPPQVYVSDGFGFEQMPLDGGRPWRKAATILPGTPFVAPSNANRVYIVEGASDGSVPYGETPTAFRSDDGGTTWTLLSAPTLDPESFVIDPEDENRLYDAFSRSSDGGLTWSRTASASHHDAASATDVVSMPGKMIHSVRPERLVATAGHRLIASVGTTVSVSDDGAQTWKPVAVMNAPVQGLAASSTDANRIAVRLPKTIVHTSDGGRTWSVSDLSALRAFQMSFSAPLLDPSDAATMYLPDADLFWKTKDGGKTWRTIATAPRARYWSPAVAALATGTRLALATNDGLSVSNDGGETWSISGMKSPVGLSGVTLGGNYVYVTGFGAARLRLPPN
jgi:photosystem II stability/assembly factor-like uncharacterized protein